MLGGVSALRVPASAPRGRGGRPSRRRRSPAAARSSPRSPRNLRERERERESAPRAGASPGRTHGGLRTRAGASHGVPRAAGSTRGGRVVFPSVRGFATRSSGPNCEAHSSGAPHADGGPRGGTRSLLNSGLVGSFRDGGRTPTWPSDLVTAPAAIRRRLGLALLEAAARGQPRARSRPQTPGEGASCPPGTLDPPGRSQAGKRRARPGPRVAGRGGVTRHLRLVRADPDARSRAISALSLLEYTPPAAQTSTAALRRSLRSRLTQSSLPRTPPYRRGPGGRRNEYSRRTARAGRSTQSGERALLAGTWAGPPPRL